MRGIYYEESRRPSLCGRMNLIMTMVNDGSAGLLSEGINLGRIRPAEKADLLAKTVERAAIKRLSAISDWVIVIQVEGRDAASSFFKLFPYPLSLLLSVLEHH